MTIVQSYEGRHPGAPIGPPVMWAAWAVEALHYLDDLDQVQTHYPMPVQGHHPDIIDIAHVRWVTGTAITALDLCAAALGRLYCGWTDVHELDLRAFEPQKSKPKGLHRLIRRMVPVPLRKAFDRHFPDNKKRETDQRRASLPATALAWVDIVLADDRYKDIHGARNRFTHSWLSRHLSCGGLPGHAGRTGFVVRQSQKALNAREMVERSRTLATDQVTTFFAVVDTL
jgi:hypothetical protein